MINEVSLNNLGTVNKNEVIIENDKGRRLTLTFSYQTIVGVFFNGNSYCHVNDWSTTTGKLLNELEPDKKARLSHDHFMIKVQEGFNYLNNID